MSALVLVALRRPYTFVVLALIILLFGSRAVLKTPTDIFPPIKIPVIAAVWTYTGLLPNDMSGRIISYYERNLTTTVSGIDHIESQSYYGSGVVKIFFQPGTDIAAAQAQITASSQTILKVVPAGSTPPNILVYDASSVPVLDLQVTAEDMTPDQIYDLASNFIRPALISVPGVAIPPPYGGTTEDVQVDLDPSKLLAYGLSAADVGTARVARPDLKVLFVTGYAENAVVGNGHLDPGMSVITKPFAVDVLGNRIKELFQSRTSHGAIRSSEISAAMKLNASDPAPSYRSGEGHGRRVKGVPATSPR